MANAINPDVLLSGVGVGDAKFPLENAQRLLDFQKRNPPTVWRLSSKDENYTLEKGILTQKVPDEVPPPPPSK